MEGTISGLPWKWKTRHRLMNNNVIQNLYKNCELKVQTSLPLRPEQGLL